MDTNLFIKSYRTEGNKVKDIQFYGDWIIDVGGEKTQYIDLKSMNKNVAPTGIDYLDTSTATSFKFKNNTGHTLYYRVIDAASYVGNGVGAIVTWASGNTISLSWSNTTPVLVGIFSDNICKNLVGFISFKKNDVPVEITHY